MNYDIEKQSAVIEEAIKQVQRIFDDYQNLCFTKRTSEFFCLELNGEAGELANLEKKSWKGKSVAKELFFDEAADVLIALMNYSNAKGVDLGQAVKDKLLAIEIKRANLLENGESY